MGWWESGLTVLVALVLVGTLLAGGLHYGGFDDATDSVRSAGVNESTTARSAGVSSGAVDAHDDGTVTSASYDRGAPVQPRLVDATSSPDGDLTVGESTTVSFELTAERRLSNVTITATDPLGLTVTAGPKRVDRVEADGTVRYELTVRPDRAVVRTLDLVVEAENAGGTATQRIPYTVTATAFEAASAPRPPTDDGVRLDPAVSVTDESGASSTPNASDESATATTSNVSTTTNTTNTTDTTNASTTTNTSTGTAGATASDIVVSGRAAYTGTDGSLYGLSNAKVRVYDVDGGERRLSRGTTNDDGSFRIVLDPASDADGDGAITAKVVVLAETRAAYVTDGSATYGFYGTSGTLTAGDTATVGSDVDGDGSKELVSAGDNAPYMATDWAYEGYAFAARNGVSKDRLPIRYPYSDWASYRWDTGGWEQIVLADRGDLAWDRSTVHHEYGHGVQTQLDDYRIPDKGDYSCHTIVSETDPSFAFVEGFAEYYEAAVPNDPSVVSSFGQDLETNHYYDTAYDYQCPPGDATGEYDGASVEASVASILWDVTDGGAGDDDSMSYSFAAVADVVARNPGDILGFYDLWDRGQRDALDSIYTTYGIDKQPPTLSASTRSTPYTSSDVSLSGSASDAERYVDTVAVRVDGGAYTTVSTGGGPWSTTRTLGDGRHSVSVRATDLHGNARTLTRTVRVSSRPPTVTTDESMVDGSGAPGTAVAIGFTYRMRYAGRATVAVRQGDTTVASTSVADLANATAPRSTTASVTLPDSVSDETYDVRVTVEDESGRTNATTLADAIQVDTTRPTVDGVAVADTYVNASTPLSFEVGATDPGSSASGVETVEVFDSATPNETTSLSLSDGVWQGSVDPARTDGNHTAVVRVVDAAGNENRTTVTYRVDSAPPNVTGTAPRYTRSLETNVSGSVTDASAVSLVVTTNRTNATIERGNVSGSYRIGVDLVEGPNAVVVEATDRAGNTARHVLDVGVDRTPPTGTLVAPGRVGDGTGPGATNLTAPTLVFEANDTLAGLDESATASNATLDGRSVAADVSRQNGTVTVHGSGLADGTHDVTVRLVDRAGNAATVEAPFVVDTVPPSVRSFDLSTPNETVQPGERLPAVVNASDDRTGVARVVAGGLPLVENASLWRGEAAAPLPIGDGTVEVVVVDAAGNRGRATADVSVGARQTTRVSDSGVATVDPPGDELGNVTLRLAPNASRANGSALELTSGVTEGNPVGTAVPDEDVVYYVQFEFNVSRAEMANGSFDAAVRTSDLRNASRLRETLTAWLFNETTDSWENVTMTRVNGTDERLVYRIDTPHYSTFALGVDVDDTPPNVTLERPNPTTDLETTELDIRASYEDGESGVDPDSVDVRVDGTALDLADARILDAGRVEISHPVDAGTHTLSVGVADAFGNRRTERWNLTVVEPSGGGGGGSAGGGGGGGAPIGGGATGEVEVVDRTLLNGTASTGEDVLVRVSLANDDPVRGMLSLELTADGTTVAEQTVAVQASTGRVVLLGHAFDRPGTHTLAVNGATVGTVTVTDASTPTPTPGAGSAAGASGPGATPTPTGTPTPTLASATPPSTPTTGIGSGFGLAVALLAVVLVAVAASRRRR